MAQQAGSEPGSGGAGYLGQADRALEDLAADTGDEALHRRMLGVDAPGGWAAPMVFPGVQRYRPGADMFGFIGVAHVGYLPEDRILGLSKLAPRGAGAVLEAEHLRMTMRGVQAPGTRVITSALRGVLLDEGSTRVEFLSLTGVTH
jgi:hypothetical protein